MDILKHIYSEFVDYAVRSEKDLQEYNCLTETFCDTADKFLPTLTQEQTDTIMELESQRNIIAAMDEEHMFCYGFQIGAKLMLTLLSP